MHAVKKQDRILRGIRVKDMGKIIYAGRADGLTEQLLYLALRCFGVVPNFLEITPAVSANIEPAEAANAANTGGDHEVARGTTQAFNGPGHVPTATGATS